MLHEVIGEQGVGSLVGTSLMAEDGDDLVYDLLSFPLGNA